MNEQRRAKVLEEELGNLLRNLKGLCAANGHNLWSMIRVARQKVHAEEIYQEPPGPSTPTMDAAKKYIGLKEKIDGKDWWNDPAHKEALEERRRQHRDGEDSDEAFAEEVKRLFQTEPPKNE